MFMQICLRYHRWVWKCVFTHTFNYFRCPRWFSFYWALLCTFPLTFHEDLIEDSSKSFTNFIQGIHNPRWYLHDTSLVFVFLVEISAHLHAPSLEISSWILQMGAQIQKHTTLTTKTIFQNPQWYLHGFWKYGENVVQMCDICIHIRVFISRWLSVVVQM